MLLKSPSKTLSSVWIQNTCSLIYKLLQPITVRNLEHSALACITLTLRANNPIAENHMTTNSLRYSATGQTNQCLDVFQLTMSSTRSRKTDLVIKGCVSKLEREKHPNSSPRLMWDCWFLLSRKLKVNSLVYPKNYPKPNYFLFKQYFFCLVAELKRSGFCFDAASSQIKEFSISIWDTLVRPLRVAQFSKMLEALQLRPRCELLNVQFVLNAVICAGLRINGILIF